MSTIRRLNRVWLFLILATLTLMIVRERAIVEKDPSTLVRLAGPLTYDDPDLLHLVTHNFLRPPSTLPYQLQEDQTNSSLDAKLYVNYRNEFAYMFCAEVISELFPRVRPGFFVEAGALDGEFLSNTLPLERKKGWTGLLIEADGEMFDQLLKKRRRAWASHSCLATHNHPHLETLVKFTRQGKVNGFLGHSARAHGTLLNLAAGATLDNSEPGHRVYESVQCLPLATLLLALNTTHVDLVSLDVEGAEVGVLRHFPWRRITVDVWLVEHATPAALTPSAIRHGASSPTLTPAATDQRIQNASINHGLSTPPTTSTSKPDVDQGFVHMFTSRGYELYRVSSDLFIPNYAFILRGSKVYRRLRTVIMFARERTTLDENLLMARLAGPLTYDDPDLLHLVTNNFLHPPSTLPYQLVQDQLNSSIEAHYYYSFRTELAYRFYAPVLEELLAGAPPGFFVEAGALDGEFLSNTLSLERERGWTGLLVEADGDMFNQLLRKRRRAWASHSCLATRGHPHRDTLIKYEFQTKFKNVLWNKFAKAHASLLGTTNGSTVDGSDQGHEIYESVQCLPLATLLLALNVTHVDLVSLDVEGGEMGVLRHFPWRRIRVDMWLVEHATPTTRRISNLTHKPEVSYATSATFGLDDANNNGSSSTTAAPQQQNIDQEFIDMFSRRGYELYRVTSDMHIPNYVFVLRNSMTHKRLVVNGHTHESSTPSTRSRSDQRT